MSTLLDAPLPEELSYPEAMTEIRLRHAADLRMVRTQHIATVLDLYGMSFADLPQTMRTWLMSACELGVPHERFISAVTYATRTYAP